MSPSGGCHHHEWSVLPSFPGTLWSTFCTPPPASVFLASVYRCAACSPALCGICDAGNVAASSAAMGPGSSEAGWGCVGGSSPSSQTMGPWQRPLPEWLRRFHQNPRFIPTFHSPKGVFCLPVCSLPSDRPTKHVGHGQ